MDQRVNLLTERLDVIADLLAVLKDQLSHGHGEKLEWIGKYFYDVVYFGLRITSSNPDLGDHQYRSPPNPRMLKIAADVWGDSDRAHRSGDISRGC